LVRGIAASGTGPNRNRKKDTRRLSEPQAPGAAGPRKENALLRIAASKRREVEALRPRLRELERTAAEAPPPRDFHGALADPGALSLIAEVKRRSPGAGAIRPGLDPAELATRYAGGGARALSVLTDGPHFQGSLEDLVRVREAVALPCLRKDFVLEPVQLFEARAAGADAVLLIVRILADGPLRELRLLAEALGMAVLVEAHDREEVARAVASGTRLLGVNNRDLATFTTDLEVTLGLLDAVPEEVVLVSESGIRTGADAERLAAAGVDAILVGEALVRAEDPEALARELSRPRPDPRRGETPAGRG
jgi:indole-3-glycerol phosphate synthase